MPDPISSSQNPMIDPKKLHRAIVDSFDMNGLRELCFKADFDFDNLREGGKSDKVLHLVQIFEDRQRLIQLAETLRELRPHFSIQMLSLSEEERKRRASANLLSTDRGEDQRSKTFIAGKSFTALIRLLSKEEVRTAVVSFQTDFEAASRQIDLLNDQKELHDLFQGLEDCYYLIDNDQKKLPADEDAWINIEINEPELQGKISDLLTVSERETFAVDENRWVQHLSKAKGHIRVGMEDFNHEQLKLGTRLIFRTLNRQPSRINAQLVSVASSLRLDTLEAAMQTIAENLTDSNIELEVVEEIQHGVEALAGLDNRLSSLVREHNAWQELDDEVRRIGTTGLDLLEDLQDAWLDLEPMSRDILGENTQTWAEEFSKVLVNLQESLDANSPMKVRRFFVRFRSQLGRRFRQVDVALLSLCKDLQRVGESLDLLLRQFNK
ncbi:MAG: hypothetical protein AAF490_29435 [Chloroflexota bacterium]